MNVKIYILTGNESNMKPFSNEKPIELEKILNYLLNRKTKQTNERRMFS